MFSPRSPLARCVRASAIGLWVTLGACVAHLLGDGSMPPLIALVPVVAATVAVAAWSARRRLSVPVALALLAVPQIAVHLLASYIHGHLMVPSLTMITAHVVSIAVTAVSIAQVERVWWSLWEWARRALRGFAVHRVLPVGRPIVLISAGSMSLPSRLEHVVSRRGPPVF